MLCYIRPFCPFTFLRVAASSSFTATYHFLPISLQDFSSYATERLCLSSLFAILCGGFGFLNLLLSAYLFSIGNTSLVAVIPSWGIYT